MVETTEHVSELTPWLRGTGYASHLEGLLLEEIPAAYQLPDMEEEPELAAICASIKRVLQKGMTVLLEDEGREERRLSRLDAKLLNTFRGAEMSQDPITPLQNSQTRQKYIQTWQKLVCYYSRVTQDKHLHKANRMPFQQTEEQLGYFTIAWELAEQLEQGRASVIKEEEEEEEEDEEEEEEEGAEEEQMHNLDQATLAFSLSLIQHRIDRRAFDSAMVSFAAMLAWDSTKKT